MTEIVTRSQTDSLQQEIFYVKLQLGISSSWNSWRKLSIEYTSTCCFVIASAVTVLAWLKKKEASILGNLIICYDISITELFSVYCIVALYVSNLQ